MRESKRCSFHMTIEDTTTQVFAALPCRPPMAALSCRALLGLALAASASGALAQH